MALYILSVSALLLITGVKISFRLYMQLDSARLELTARLLFGLVKIRGNAVACWFPFVLYVNGKPHSLPKRKQKTGLPIDIWRGTEVEEIALCAAVGIKQDGALSVILAGTLRELILSLLVLTEPKKLYAQARPIFDHSTFWIELEGIASVHPWKIIHAAIKRKISKIRKVKEYDASC